MTPHLGNGAGQAMEVSNVFAEKTRERMCSFSGRMDPSESDQQSHSPRRVEHMQDYGCLFRNPNVVREFGNESIKRSRAPV